MTTHLLPAEIEREDHFNQKFVYQKLDSEKSEIRLLQLLSGPDEDIVRCRLRHVSLTEQVPYAALSYHWGEHSETRMVEINGIKCEITTNLADCLRQMRHRWSAIELWIDALCIDQSSGSERASQVLRMFAIYQEARVVVVWLGKTADGSEKVMHALSRNQGEEQPYDLGSHFSRPVHESSRLPSREEFEAFLHRSYWHRTWIIQEIVAARRLCILCGEQTIELRDITSFLETLLYHESNTGSASSTIQELFNIRTARRDQKPPGLLDVLHRTSKSLSTEAYDKVYALLGLVKDRTTFVTEPNYQQSHSQLCQVMARNAMIETGFLDILLLANNQLNRHLPSWCPDFLAAGCWNAGMIRYVSGEDRKKRLGVMSDRWSTTDPTRVDTTNTFIDIIHGTLQVKGLKLKQVHQVGEIRKESPWAGLRSVSSETGFLGWANSGVMVGDWFYVLQGCTLPVLLRSSGDNNTHTSFVGRIYVGDALKGSYTKSLIKDGTWLELC